MRFLRDHRGVVFRLSDERLEHILEHPEMRGLVEAIAEMLREPERVVESLSDPFAYLYYRYYEESPVGAKFLCVVARMSEEFAFVLTAYLTDRVKRGVPLWPRSK